MVRLLIWIVLGITFKSASSIKVVYFHNSKYSKEFIMD